MSTIDSEVNNRIQIPCSYLKGHTGSVLCLGYKYGSLLSGSEDKTARLWDLREKNNLHASLCMVASGEVTSVAFGHSSSDEKKCNDGKEEEVSSPSSTTSVAFDRDYSVFLGVDNQVWEYDLRRANAPILKQEVNSKSLMQSNDEINQIVLSDQQRKRDGTETSYLAAGDDTGKIQLLDLQMHSQQDPSEEQQKQKKQSKRQQRGGNRKKQQQKNVSTDSNSIRVLDHDTDSGNMAMVTSCVFRPRCKGLELASGGTDCTVQLWDVNKPKRPLSSYAITPDTSENNNQLCNPPMVHFLSWGNTGKILAAGLGDGTCSILSIENRSLVMVGRFQTCFHSDGAGVPIASVVFPPDDWYYSNSNKSTRVDICNDRFLCCASNDGNVGMWDLGSVIVQGDDEQQPQQASNIVERLSLFLSPSDMDGNDGGNTATATYAGDTKDNPGPQRLLNIQHGKKANWMVCSNRREKAFPTTLFVADTTDDITAYTIPLR